jgi:hypothetical protein
VDEMHHMIRKLNQLVSDQSRTYFTARPNTDNTIRFTSKIKVKLVEEQHIQEQNDVHHIKAMS